MPRRNTIIAAALATAALAAPTALAQAADIHAPPAKTTADAHKQDLRSPDTRDAARATTPSHSNTARPDAAGNPNLTTAADRALAQERYYMSYGKNAATDDNVTPAADPALAQERYYASYGEPEPLARPQSPVPSDDTPWLPIALSITAALVIAATSATQLRRLRVRRRRAARSTA